MRRQARWPVLATAVVLGSAHVGSPDAWFEGDAGPYRVLVHVEAPGVIPGIATVNVRVDAMDIERVTAVANRFDATGAAPPPEVARPLAGQPGWYRTELWIMTSGSYSVTVAVSGARGSGEAVIPLAAAPMRRLRFSATLGLILGGVGAVLFAGLITLVGVAAREGVLAPGERPDPRRRKRARWTMAVCGGALVLVLLGGKAWWNAEDAAFVRSLWKPMASRAIVENGVLTFAIEDSTWIRRHDVGWLRSRGVARLPELIHDHGKLMHLFVVDAAGGRAFAHLHPVTTDSVRFTVPMPPLPSGRHAVFADIVHENGFAETLVATLEWAGERSPAGAPELPAGAAGDPDDAWAMRAAGTAAEPASSTRSAVTLADGSTLRWLRPEGLILAGEDAGLRFTVTAPDGAGPLEPYMGMDGHAVVVRDDAAVFVHLHPLGTISPAAQMRFLSASAAHAAPRAHAIASGHASMMDVPPADSLSFPYSFPEPGRYHIWIQVKRDGRILTGAFEAVVEQER